MNVGSYQLDMAVALPNFEDKCVHANDSIYLFSQGHQSAVKGGEETTPYGKAASNLGGFSSDGLQDY